MVRPASTGEEERRQDIASSRRDHTILVSPTGLVTVTGGKWTTYRRMGQDTIDRACSVASLPKAALANLGVKIHGWTMDASTASASEWERVYGSDLPLLQRALGRECSTRRPLHPRLPFRAREVIWAARYEMARTVEESLPGALAPSSSMRAQPLKRLQRSPVSWPGN